MRVIETQRQCRVRSIDVDNDFIYKVAKITSLLDIIRPSLTENLDESDSIVNRALIETDAFMCTLTAIIDGVERTDDFKVTVEI